MNFLVSQSFRLLGILDVKNTPCARDAILYGAGGSFAIGLLHFLSTSESSFPEMSVCASRSQLCCCAVSFCLLQLELDLGKKKKKRKCLCFTCRSSQEVFSCGICRLYVDNTWILVGLMLLDLLSLLLIF